MTLGLRLRLQFALERLPPHNRIIVVASDLIRYVVNTTTITFIEKINFGLPGIITRLWDYNRACSTGYYLTLLNYCRVNFGEEKAIYFQLK